MEERLLNGAEKLMKKKQLPLSNTPGIRIKNEPASNAGFSFYKKADTPQSACFT